MTRGSRRERRAAPAPEAASVVAVTKRFGRSFSRRNGYLLYALQVMPPPQGFSHASFSSMTTVSRPADARRSAAKAPAGPPPSTATRFIRYFAPGGLMAGWPGEISGFGVPPGIPPGMAPPGIAP